MLAKQGWQLMTKPGSLCARVMKGKYFHNSDFLDVRKKRNSSHVGELESNSSWKRSSE
jgi:hypothetical protein